MRKWVGLLGVVMAVGISQAPAPASAQLRRVLDLNRQAMEAYTNLDIEQAMSLLQQALSNAQSNGVGGSPLARTYANLGVVAIGGFGDNGQGLSYFTQALQTDGNVQLDPLTSTPDIQSVFTLARNRVGTGGGGGGGGTGGTGGTGGGTTTVEPPPPMAGPGQIPHQPISEQLRQTALPIFIEAPEDAAVGNVYVYYKAHGMREFRRVQMRRMQGGFGVELPCADMYQGQAQYYVVAFGEDNTTPIGTAGTPDTPFSVNIVAERSLPPPALPGAPPPEQCVDSECPPGMACDDGRGTAGLGDTCMETNDCRAGLTCDDNFCIAGDYDDDDDDADSGDRGGQPWFFLHAGFSLGVGYATANRAADSAPSEPGTASAASYIPNGTDGCDVGENQYCVRVEKPGFLLAPALRFSFGVWIIPRLAIAATFRYQLSSGQGQLSSILLGLRLQYQLSEPSAQGLNGNIHVGTSYGQIQLQPPQNGAEEPFIISGLNGAQIGGTVGYRFVDNFGIHVTPEVHLLFPTFLFAFDLTVGLEVAF